MSDIFISYSKSDRAKAEVLAKALEREGWSVWWDPKIRPGQSFDEVIDRALEAARCVIVLWSKKSALSDYVKSEAWEGKQRGILIPALIEDDVRIPLDFRRLHASRLTDWRGEESGYLEFDELKDAIAELLGRPAEPPREMADSEATGTRTIVEPSKPGRQMEGPEGVYLDPETKLMWTKEDNGRDINWHEANEYANELRLGGYSDWRLPTIEELEKLYDPNPGNTLNIRKPFKLTRPFVWSSTKEGSDSAWGFNFSFGKRFHPPHGLLPLRLPSFVCASFRRMMGALVIGSFFEIFWNLPASSFQRAWKTARFRKAFDICTGRICSKKMDLKASSNPSS